MSKENGLSKYRFVILLAIIPSIISTEMMWLSLAPISSIAEQHYGVSSLSIAMFSMSYMIMYILFSIPASWTVDKFGYRFSLIIGALITAVFGFARFFFADNFTIVLIAQFIIAIGQPFLLNISTKVPANWFPLSERATAGGILTMAQYIGFAVPMLLAPMIAEKSGIDQVYLVFAIIASVSALIAIVFTREKPAIAPPGPSAPKEEISLKSIHNLLKNKTFLLVLMICFISIGIFNTLLTLLETILLPRGITSGQAGVIGTVFVLAGIIGAVVLPIISDNLHKRTIFFVGNVSLLVPIYLAFSLVPNYLVLNLLAGAAGFLTMGVAPILFQHGTEVAYPLPEGTSLGVILLMGQISGALFVYLFDVLNGISNRVVVPMLCIVVLTMIEVPVALRMKESKLMGKEE